MENEWFKCMRDLTPEEQTLVNEQIRKISNPTGVTLEGILNGETYIPRSQIDKVIEEIEKVAEEESFDSRKWSQGLRYSIKIIRKYCDVPETNVGNVKKEKQKMSGLYNLVNGYNPSCILILPMLGRSSSEYPRFRDCFVSEENDKEYIDVYTRVGGGNRNCGFGEEKLYEDENFVITFDDDFDNTYGTYRFNVPEKWKEDFDLIIKGKLSEVSDEYIAEVKKYYTAEFVDKIFKKGSEDAKETC